MGLKRGRGLFAFVVGVVIAALLIAACGGDEEAQTPTARPAASPTVPPTPTPAFGPGEPRPNIAKEGRGYRFVANQPNDNERPTRGGVANSAFNAAVRGLDSATNPSFEVHMATHSVYNKLVRCKFGPEMTKYDRYSCELTGDLAESWAISADGLTYTFKLRDGVKFQNVPPLNGRPLVAKDVVESLKLWQTSPRSWSFENMQIMKDVTAPDDKTVVVTLHTRNADFLEGSIGLHSTIIRPGELANIEGKYDQNAVGTGPFILTKFEVGRRLEYRANPDYHIKGRPILDGYTVTIVPDEATQNAGLLTGQFDTATPGGGARTFAELQDILRRNPTFVGTTSDPQASQIFIMFEIAKGKFADLDVRRAISMAIDRVGLCVGLLDGFCNYSPPIPWYYVFDKPPTEIKDLGQWYQYNPQEAQRILEAKGLKKPGEPLKLKYEYTSLFGSLVAGTAEFLRDSMKKAGIDLEIKDLDFQSQFLPKFFAFTGTTFDDLGWGNTNPKYSWDGDVYLQMHSSSTIPSPPRNPIGRSVKIKDAELDRILDEARAEVDPVKRRALFKQVWDIELDKLYRPGFYHGNSYGWSTGRLRNTIVNEHHFFPHWGSQQWEIVWKKA